MYNTKYRLIVLFLAIALIFGFSDLSEAKPKTSKTQVKSKSKQKSKSKGKAKTSTKAKTKAKSSKKVTEVKGKKGKKGKLAKVKKVKYPSMQVNKEMDLGDGMFYKHLFVGNGYSRFSVHVLSSELNEKNKAFVLKGADHIDDLERLHDMINRNDSIEEMQVFGATNANFWKAYSNLPIGPTIKNGEVIQMKSYKEWNSALWDDQHVIIDNFLIGGLLQNKYGEWKEISFVNHRKDSSGLVFYNRFGGDTIPYMSSKEFENALLQIKKEILSETYQAQDSLEVQDSTEQEFDVALLQNELLDQKRIEKIEYSMPKIRLGLLDTPSLNADLRYVVLGETSGTCPRPRNGAILSLGADFDKNSFKYKVGDTVLISFNTTTHSDLKFMNGVCGTPRLVRNGSASHEASKEGSKGRRFVAKPLPRTAIGTDKDGKMMYIVAVESNSKSSGISGANLSNMSSIMKKIGCYDAMNLDGGGSTVMVVNGKNVTSHSRPDYSRKISVGVCLGKKKDKLIGKTNQVDKKSGT